MEFVLTQMTVILLPIINQKHYVCTYNLGSL